MVRCATVGLSGIEVVPRNQDLPLRLWTYIGGEWELIPIKGHRGDVLCVSVRADGLKIVFELQD